MEGFKPVIFSILPDSENFNLEVLIPNLGNEIYNLDGFKGITEEKEQQIKKTIQDSFAKLEERKEMPWLDEGWIAELDELKNKEVDADNKKKIADATSWTRERTEGKKEEAWKAGIAAEEARQIFKKKFKKQYPKLDFDIVETLVEMNRSKKNN